LPADRCRKATISGGKPQDVSGLQSAAGDGRTLGKGFELFEGDFADYATISGKGAEAAIGAGDDAVLANDLGEALDALCDEFRVFDKVGTGIDRAGDQYLVIGYFCI